MQAASSGRPTGPVQAGDALLAIRIEAEADLILEAHPQSCHLLATYILLRPRRSLKLRSRGSAWRSRGCEKMSHDLGPGEDLEDRLWWIDLCERIPDLEAASQYLAGVSKDVQGTPVERMHPAMKVDRLTDDSRRALEIG